MGGQGSGEGRAGGKDKGGDERMGRGWQKKGKGEGNERKERVVPHPKLNPGCATVADGDDNDNDEEDYDTKLARPIELATSVSVVYCIFPANVQVQNTVQSVSCLTLTCEKLPTCALDIGTF